MIFSNQSSKNAEVRNYSLWTKSILSPNFVNKDLLEHGTLRLLYIVYGGFPATMAELSS